MNIIKILIIEDEEDLIEIYEDNIIEFNTKTTINIFYDIAKDKDTAEMKLKLEYYDAVFVDLNLSKNTLGEIKAEGNELVDYIMKYMRYPVFVVTGKENEHITELAETNTFITIFIKSSENVYNRLFEQLEKIYLTGLTKVLGPTGSINKHLNEIFWNHLSSTMPHWLSIECDRCDIEKAISRYTLTHLYEYMEEPNQGERILYDPAEMYIRPPIKTTTSPGDIVEKDGTRYLVLTPACTIAKDCNKYQLVKIIHLKEMSDLIKIKSDIFALEKTISEINEKLVKKENEQDRANLVKKEESYQKKKNTLGSTLNSYISNNKGMGYHFLPAFIDIDESLVDFQDITTIEASDITSYDRKMTVAIHYFKDIQARFATFYARQGSPDFDSKMLTNNFLGKFMSQ